MTTLKSIILCLGLLLCGYVVAVSLWLPIYDQPSSSDAIIVVSGGDTRGRTLHGVSLWEQGLAPTLVFSGAAKDPTSASNARAMKAIAMSRGVPSDAIVLDEQSRDTKENAASTKQLIAGYDKVILVTSEYHQRRAYHEFDTQLGDSTEIINAPAKDKNWGRKSWFLTPYGWWISITEPIKLMVARLS